MDWRDVARDACAAAAVVWALSLPLAAYAASGRLGGARGYPFAAIVYSTGAVLCHQHSDRSFHPWAAQMPVCARCAGIYTGAAVGALIGAAFVRQKTRGAATDWHRVRLALLVAAVPTGLTLIYEWSTGQAPGHWTRAIAGAPVGVSVAHVATRAFRAPRAALEHEVD